MPEKGIKIWPLSKILNLPLFFNFFKNSVRNKLHTLFTLLLPYFYTPYPTLKVNQKLFKKNLWYLKIILTGGCKNIFWFAIYMYHLIEPLHQRCVRRGLLRAGRGRPRNIWIEFFNYLKISSIKAWTHQTSFDIWCRPLSQKNRSGVKKKNQS